jgi:hypothetical protein
MQVKTKVNKNVKTISKGLKTLKDINLRKKKKFIKMFTLVKY